MTSFSAYIENELEYLMHLEKDILNDPLSPERHTIIKKEKLGNIYYWKVETSNKKRNYTYIGDSNSKKLHKLARASYKKILLSIVRHNMKVLQKAAKSYRRFSRSDILAKLSPCLRDVLFDTEFDSIMKDLKAWAEEDYTRNPMPFKDGIIRAKDGTRVRSRAECIIYNLLLEAGIPFRYEPLLILKRKNESGQVEEYYEYPDFLIKCPDGSYIIIEHAGMLSSAQYTDNLAMKLKLYQQNGFWFGRSLFVTGEDVYGGINSMEISKLIDCIRLRFPYL